MPDDMGGINSKSAAAALAAQLSQGAENANTEGIQQPSPEPPIERTSNTSGVGDVDQSPEVRQYSDTGTDLAGDLEQTSDDTAQEPLETPVVPGDEIYHELLEVGIDLGVPPSQVPPEQLPVYNQLANRAFDLVAQATAESRQAQEMVLEMQEFAKQLDNDPRRLALMIALKNPDTFNEVVETIGRMQEDDRERDLVMREIEADVKFNASRRQAEAAQRVAAMQKASRVRRVTHAVASELGISPDSAEKIVAAEIQARNGQFDIKDVGPTLRGLLGERVLKRVKPREAVSPQTQTATQQADTGQVEGISTPSQPVQQDTEKRVLTPREAIRQAFQNTRNLGRT